MACGGKTETKTRDLALAAGESRKGPKFLVTKNIAVITLKLEQIGLINREMPPKYADGMANSADPDQIAP